ncbi:MAG TPA: pirin family protein [Stellaceae bacterium]|nr:pirin family protein [Stellaceae bacterium]
MMTGSYFVLRASERGYDRLASTGPNASYVAGHPDAFITRHSSFNFHEYQSGRAGFGKIRVFGDEVFSRPGCGYNMHPHHNFLIAAFILKGSLTHINTMGRIDVLGPGDYYLASFGSGGKHCELNLETEDMNAIYLWVVPDRLMLPPTYARSHFDADATRNRITTLIGNHQGALPIPQDLKVSRLVSDRAQTRIYLPTSPAHGVYTFVLEGKIGCDGATLERRDSIGIWDADRFTIETAAEAADVLFVETIM